MKRMFALAAGFILTGLLIAPVSAVAAAGPGTQQKSDKSSQAAQKKKLSKRSKAKAEVTEKKAERNAQTAGSAK